VLPLEQSHMADPVFQAHGKRQNGGLGDLGPQCSSSQVMFQRNLVSHGDHCGRVAGRFQLAAGVDFGQQRPF